MSIFISFEGGEGSGKTTQAEILSGWLRQAGFPTLLVHEPGTTPLGQYLRKWLKREGSMSHEAELFLFAAARAELVAKVINPALEEKKIVVADRYADSTVAYQGYGRRLRLKYVRMVNDLATQGATPDLTFFLDCPPERGLERRQASRLDQEGTRRFEEETLKFHRRVREGYLKIASREPERWCIIDATKGPDQISAEIWGRVQGLLAQRASGPSRSGRSAMSGSGSGSE